MLVCSRLLLVCTLCYEFMKVFNTAIGLEGRRVAQDGVSPPQNGLFTSLEEF
jgi:hypothetical protein